MDVKKKKAVNSKEFLSLLHNSDQLNKDDFKDSLKLQEEFPYFLIPKVLGAKYEWNNSATTSTTLLHWAAVLSPDRKRLKELVTEKIDLTHITGEGQKPLLPDEKEEKEEVENQNIQPITSEDIDSEAANIETPSRPNRDEILRRLEENLKKIKKKDAEGGHSGEHEKKKEVADSSSENEKEDLIASIAKKEELYQRKKEQLDLINNFDEKPIRLSRERMDQEENLPDLSEKSTLLNDNMLSESFAKLLVKQNKKQEAIEIYRKLILKFPKKKTYFADQIEQLKA
ncbi:hypothetical protein [Cyclobacterium plantarum]|uniref:Tetratricopeptide repeat protein n=1 Tax=Cyclobacterium plantarum TaxID=2716263 RepID=A0ABX0HDI7_9BACT|nr:hypothetical protein [Cyclobacterium plantarum]NHE59380.1 hypothetical protein [Cyclobacterium plantarum]